MYKFFLISLITLFGNHSFSADIPDLLFDARQTEAMPGEMACFHPLPDYILPSTWSNDFHVKISGFDGIYYCKDRPAKDMKIKIPGKIFLTSDLDPKKIYLYDNAEVWLNNPDSLTKTVTKWTKAISAIDISRHACAVLIVNQTCRAVKSVNNTTLTP